MSAASGIVIIGGGPAGLATARGYREADGGETVTMLAAEDHAPYQRPPLTKGFLRGELDREELPIEEEGWFAEHDVVLRRSTRVTSIDPETRTVAIDGAPAVPYSACVLATGSEPARPPVPGADRPGVLVVRTVEDSLRLRGRDGPVAVIGSGFIGCEAAASLAMRGAEVTLVSQEGAPQQARLGAEVGDRIADWLKEAGVRLVLGAEVASIEASSDGGLVIATGDGAGAVKAGTVLAATGVRPRTELAEAAGIAIDGGAVKADASQRTSAPGVLAAGDVAFADNATAGRPLRVEHWGEALNQGAVAGGVLAGDEVEWRGAPGFWSTIGGHTIKYAAWGDGYETVALEASSSGSFTAWYASSDGTCVGVLAHDRDEDYDRGRKLVERGAPSPP